MTFDSCVLTHWVTCFARRDATRTRAINRLELSCPKTLNSLILLTRLMANDGWSTPAGIADLKKILCGLVPWPAGPYDWQLMSTARTLDGINQLVVTACGDGKTAAAYLPLLVLEMLAADSRLPRHGIRVPERPVVLIVTPLSDLGHSQVSEKFL